MQGCRLPAFSMRSQTFCYTADFSTAFYICLKPRHCCTSHYKTTSSFDFVLQRFSVTPDKNGKKCSYPAGSFCAWAHLWPAVTRRLSTSRSFQSFLKHNVGNTGEAFELFTNGCNEYFLVAEVDNYT